MKSSGKSAYKPVESDYEEHTDLIAQLFSPKERFTFKLISDIEIQGWIKELEDEQDVQIDQTRNPLIEKLTHPEKASLTSRKKKPPVRNLVSLRLDPETQKEIRLLEQTNQEFEAEKKHYQKLSHNDILRESQEQSFMEFFEQEVQSLEKVQRLGKEFQYELERLQHANSIAMRDLNPQEIRRQMEHKIRKGQLMFELLNETLLQREVDPCKKIQQSNKKLNEQNAKLILQIQAKKLRLKQLRETKKQKDTELYLFKQTLEEKDQKINLDKLENIIIKMQLGESSLFRYGSRLVQSEYDKWAFSEGTATKWPFSVDITDLLDLKIFIITLLTPMARFILNDFSHQAKVYKILFGFYQRMGEDQIASCVKILRKRIKKHFMQKKLPNLTECIKNTVAVKRKKLIFICKEQAFKEIMNELLSELKNFSNPLMCIFSIQLEMTEDLFENTSFKMGKIHIDYVFDKVGANTVIEVLFCPFETITAADVTGVRKTMQKFESAFWWFDIPKGIHVGRIEEIKSVHEVLKKIKKQHS